MVDYLASYKEEARQDFFEGNVLRTYQFEGKPTWVCREVGALAGYEEEGKRFATKITGEWSEEFSVGLDYEVLKGARLQEFARLSPDSVPGHTASILVLYESGLWLALAKSHKPVGIRLRRFLASEVLPALQNRSLPLASAPTADPTLQRALEAITALTAEMALDRQDRRTQLLEQAKQPPPPPAEEVKFHPFSLMSPEGIVEACQAAMSKSEIAEAFLGYSDLHEFLAEATTKLQLNEVRHVVYNALKTARGLNANPTLLKCRRDVTLWCWAVSIVEAAHDSTRAKKERGSK